MNSALDFAFPATIPAKSSSVCRIRRGIPSYGFRSHVRVCSLPPSTSLKAESCLKRDMHKQRSILESMFCYDKPIPEERIDEPVGLSMSERDIGDNERCTCCEAKGALLCAICSGAVLPRHITTEINGDGSMYVTEIHQRESSGVTHKLISSNPTVEELESLLKQGNVVDAFLSLEPYDYQQKNGIRLIAK